MNVMTETQGNGYLLGWMQDWRMYKGAAPHQAASFTPPVTPYLFLGCDDAATGRYIYDLNRTEAEGLYTYGLFEFTSGLNDDWSTSVKYYQPFLMELVEQPPRSVAAGSTYKLIAGCSKTRDACKARNNMINFGGFPDVPTPNTANEGPDY